MKRDPGDETLYRVCFVLVKLIVLRGSHDWFSIFFGSMIASELILQNMDDFDPYQT